MRAFLRLAVVLAALLAGGGMVSATGTEVAVLFNGTTQVNKETYKFLQRNFSQQNPGLTLKAVQDPAAIKAGQYKAVVVLSTGVASGLDPVLKSFVEKYTAKKELFVVSLLAGSKTLTVEHQTAEKAPLGVDTYTAASAWSEGADKMTYIKIHAEWVQNISDAIKTLK